MECVAKLLKKVEKSLDRSICLSLSHCQLRAEDILSGAWMWKREEKYATVASENDIAPIRRHIKIPFRKFKCAIKFNLHLLKHLRNRDFPKYTLFYNRDTPAIRVSRIVWGH